MKNKSEHRKMLRKRNVSQNFYFKNISNKELISLIDKDLPISLKHVKNIIENIYEKYPTISKLEITYIVKALIYSFRDLLILGNTISINAAFKDYKIYFNKFVKNNITYYGVKAKIKTSPKLKYETIE